MEQFSIRAAREADLHEMYDIEVKTFSDKHAYSFTALRQLFDISGRLCLIAESTGLLGYTLGAMHSTEKMGWILNLAVHPDARRQGIGKALTCELTDRLVEKGARFIQLTVERNNQSAIQLPNTWDLRKSPLRETTAGLGKTELS